MAAASMSRRKSPAAPAMPPQPSLPQPPTSDEEEDSSSSSSSPATTATALLRSLLVVGVAVWALQSLEIPPDVADTTLVGALFLSYIHRQSSVFLFCFVLFWGG